MKLKILAVIALGAVGVGAAVFALGGFSPNSASATQYLTSAAVTGDVTNDIAATGSLAANATYGLSFGSAPYLVTSSSTAPNSSTIWPVKEVKVKVGDTVTKGQVLATATTTDLKRQLADAQRSVLSAEVSRRAAKTTLSDANTAGVTAQIRQAKIGLYGAQSQLAQAAKSRDDLTTQIALATLSAPIAGVVTTVNVTAGFDAPSGSAIVIQSSTFQVTTNVVESDLVNVKIGQAATVSISAVGASVDGTVSAISPVAASSSSSSVVEYPVTVTLQNVPATAKSGMTADVTVTIASATGVLTVPAAALRGTAGNYSVLTMGANGTPTSTPVQVGLVTNTLAEITSGITAGQEVVTGTTASRTGTTATTTGGFGGGIAIPGGFGGGTGAGRRTTP